MARGKSRRQFKSAAARKVEQRHGAAASTHHGGAQRHQHTQPQRGPHVAGQHGGSHFAQDGARLRIALPVAENGSHDASTASTGKARKPANRISGMLQTEDGCGARRWARQKEESAHLPKGMGTPVQCYAIWHKTASFSARAALQILATPSGIAVVLRLAAKNPPVFNVPSSAQHDTSTQECKCEF